MEVAILTISLRIEGLGIGPLLRGHPSEFFGRSNIYLISFIWFFLLNLPVACANSAPLHLVFQFHTGFSGAASMSVAGGSITDLLSHREVGQPMAVYIASPVVGPLIGGFINQNTNWRWTYYVILMWTVVEIALLVLFVPETYRLILLKRKAQRLRKKTGDNWF
ncbi:MFS general substrate transporter [Calocera cornea HHB12733]|uniref:MFS general substrate transporter n=1 Tax=Calocera cornea HHB12733 TaxID=1353952 RepID=A0A165J6C3_9BASI|nr:MFS general substrate transporter [Calocera cornea HHB12733]